MAFIAFLIGLGIVMEGFTQAHSYFSRTNAAAVMSTNATDARATE